MIGLGLLLLLLLLLFFLLLYNYSFIPHVYKWINFWGHFFFRMIFHHPFHRSELGAARVGNTAREGDRETRGMLRAAPPMGAGGLASNG